ncbi:hypothetical protein NIES4074_28810 [Cylindrospermum sp. NIES-4074]|nr:hypothetical protein NIES4074_28810 [Cylindrospermum sp. NIES-4074]
MIRGLLAFFLATGLAIARYSKVLIPIPHKVETNEIPPTPLKKGG